MFGFTFSNQCHIHLKENIISARKFGYGTLNTDYTVQNVCDSAGKWNCQIGVRERTLQCVRMLPYQAVAMDYAVASAGFHHHQRPGGLPVMGLPGPGPGLNPGLNTAFTHSWFVQTSPDICRQQQASNQSHLEPGHVSFFSLYFYFQLQIILRSNFVSTLFTTLSSKY